MTSIPNGNKAPDRECHDHYRKPAGAGTLQEPRRLIRQIAVPGDDKCHQFEIDDPKQRCDQKAAEIACHFAIDRGRADQGDNCKRRKQLLDRDHGGESGGHVMRFQ